VCDRITKFWRENFYNRNSGAYFRTVPCFVPCGARCCILSGGTGCSGNQCLVCVQPIGTVSWLWVYMQYLVLSESKERVYGAR
jgi:hypothetical protein